MLSITPHPHMKYHIIGMLVVLVMAFSAMVTMMALALTGGDDLGRASTSRGTCTHAKAHSPLS
jgi:hypothetical protein